MLSEAYDCVEDGNFDEALKLYDSALKIDPTNSSIYVDKGATLQNMGRLKLAIRSFNKALSLSPDNLNA